MTAGALPVPPRTRLTLERVLGVTSLSNTMLAVNPVTGEIAYAAGCIVVIYNLRRNKQVRYYRVEKTVSCLCFSPTGQYLAIGEKGYMPAITIWDGANGTLCAELQMHQYGVACMAFNRDGNYLFSAGLVHDQHAYAWDLNRDDTTQEMKGKAIGVAMIEEKVLGMDYCLEGNFFVTVGEKHAKFWFLDADNKFLTTGFEVNAITELQGRSGVMASKVDATFTSVACGHGACKLKTFAVTSDGTLCCFGVSCVMERLVSLEATCGNALSVTESYVAVGGTSSIVRLFDPVTLEYKATMPFPPGFGKANDALEKHNATALQPEYPMSQPATLGLRVSGSHLVALYSDRSIFIYDIADLENIHVERSFLFHSGSVRDLKIAGRVKGVNGKGKLVYHIKESLYVRSAIAEDHVPLGTIVSGSDDNTLRFWHLDLHKATRSNRFSHEPGDAAPANGQSKKAWNNAFSQEMLAIFYHNAEVDFEGDPSLVLGGTCAWNDTSDIHAPSKDQGSLIGIRALALHPDLNQIVSGDKDGSLVSVTLPLSENTPHEIGSHSAEIMCIDYGDISRTKRLIASGGRDRIVQIRDDSDREGKNVITLADHSGAVTAIKFTHDGKKLISCGADKMLVFSEVRVDGKITRQNSVPFSSGKIYAMAVGSNDEFVVTSCNNRLDVLPMGSNKPHKTHHVGEQHRIDVCPASYCVAMSGSASDKTINIVDLESGETLADGTGHGEVLTAIKFTPDCRRLVSSSSDGCIFVWRLADELQTAIKARLPRISESQVSPPVPPPQAFQGVERSVPAAAHLMPPPAPPPIVQKVPQAKAKSPNAAQSKGRKSVIAVSPRQTQRLKRRDSLKKPSAVGWKGKSKAAPGPMADIPMDDWMRTRDSAKETVLVHDDITGAVETTGTTPEAELKTSREDIAELIIDRSQTPDWARTITGNTATPGKKTSTKRTERSKQAGGKWIGNRLTQSDETIMASGILESESQTAIHQDVGATECSNSNNADLANLSIAGLHLSRSAVLTGSSLALEREQLEKRKKQMETAKAVAEMNTRLSQLGLLRGSRDSLSSAIDSESTAAIDSNEVRATSTAVDKTTPIRAVAEMNARLGQLGLLRSSQEQHQIESGDIAAPVINPIEGVLEPSQVSATSAKEAESMKSHGDIINSQPDASISGSSPVRKDYDFGEIPPEMFESIDLSLSKTAGSIGKTRKSFTEESEVPVQSPSVKTSVAVHLDQSMSTFTSGFAVQTLPHPNRQTLSTGNRNESQDHISVDQSLSVFSGGYSSLQPQASMTDTHHTQKEHPLEFQSSVSIRPERKGAPRTVVSSSQVMIDRLAVGASLSSLTDGFQVSNNNSGVPDCADLHQQSVDLGAVNASMSSFTSGYTDNNCRRVPGTAQSMDLSCVSSSLSHFTAGYDEGPCSKDSNARLAVTPEPDRSLTPTKRHTDPRSRGAVDESMSVFTVGYTTQSSSSVPPCDSVNVDLTGSLSSFTTGYEVDNTEKKSTMRTRGSLEMTSITDLDQHLTSLTSSLDGIFQQEDADPEVDEIRSLASQLHAAVQRYAATH